MKLHKITAIVTGCLMLCGMLSADAGAAQSEPKKWTLTVASGMPNNSSTTDSFGAFKAFVEKESGGRITVNTHYAGSLGDDRSTTERMAMRDFRGVMSSTMFCINQITNDPRWLFLELPYTAPDVNMQYKIVAESPQYKTLIEETAKKYNIRVLGIASIGPYAFTCAGDFADTLEKMRRFKIRITENRAAADFTAALGVQAAVMSFPELYSGIQQGTVNGSYMGTSLKFYSGIWDVAKYCTVLKSGDLHETYQIAEDLWQSLHPVDRDIFERGFKVMLDTGRERHTGPWPEQKAKMEAAGVRFKEVSPEVEAELRKAAESIYPAYRDKMGHEFWDGVTAYVKSISK